MSITNTVIYHTTLYVTAMSLTELYMFIAC